MRKRNRRQKYLVLSALVLLISLGYAFLSANLTITGVTHIGNNEVNVYFNHAIVTQFTLNGTATATNQAIPTITGYNNQKVAYKFTLNQPGDTYEFNVDIVNDGSIDVIINELTTKIKLNGSSEEELTNENMPEYLEYSVTYVDGSEIQASHRLNAGNTETIKVHIKIKSNVTNEIYEEVQGQTIEFKLLLDYNQASTAAHYTVSFDTNGGTVPTFESKEVYVEKNYGELPTTTRDGYTFLGWSEYNLPSEYQKVEYIESTGTQYIDTGFKPNQDTRFEVKFNASQKGSGKDGRFIGGVRSEQTSLAYHTFIWDPNIYSGYNNSGNVDSAYKYSVNTDTIINLEKNKLYVDNNLVTTHTYNSFQTVYNMYLFGLNNSGSFDSVQSYIGKIYYVKIWDDENLIRNYIPVYKYGTNEIGLYDTVNNIFYNNQGSGTFNKGDEIANNYVTSSTRVITNDDHTLYAIWGHNPTITFDPSGGTVSPVNKTLVYNSIYGELPIPTKDGYTFVGWKSRNDDYILPSGYQEVEYIASSGTQYINTGVIPSNTMGIYSRLSSSNITSDLVYFGSRNTQDGRFWVGNNKSQIYYGWNGNTYKSIEENTVNIIKMNYLNDRKSVLNDEVIRDIGSTSLSSNTRPIYIFAGNDKGSASYKSSIKLYEFKISDGDDIIHNYIPCYRKSDGTIGLYDIVEGIFYDNKGSGTFEKGSNIYNVTSESIVITAEDHTLYAVWEEE